MSTSAKLPPLSIDRASASDRPILENLAQFYIYEFESIVAGDGESGIRPDGRYSDMPYLEAYWREEGREAYLLRVGQTPAGFALINHHFKLEPPGDWAMAEFFVHRHFQRQKIGQRAAHRLFADHPGRWELSVLRGNLKAQLFWRATIASFPGARDLKIVEQSPEANDGEVFRFVTG
jgi:predicted acetyltransferase